MASPLWSRANGRVDEYRKSVLSVHENLLHVKGFLGENIGSMRGMSSVGARAARAAGVIVDADGKLRCPPGTPNANQFTDYRMSNCFAPGAGAARRIARRIASEISDSLAAAKQLMRSDNPSEITATRTLAALAALDSIDYTKMNQPEVFSAIARIGAELQGNAGTKFLDAALGGLERRGKLEPEEKVELASAINNVAVASRPKLISRILDAVGSAQRRDIRVAAKKGDKPEYPNVARRVGNQIKAVFDAKRFEKKVKDYRKAVIAKYLPGRDESQGPVQLAEDLRQAMGYGRENMPPESIVQSMTVDEMLEQSLDAMIGNPAKGEPGQLQVAVDELERLVAEYGQMVATLQSLKTDEEWQAIANMPHNRGKTIEDLKRERDVINYDFQMYQKELNELKAVLDQLKRAQDSGSIDTFREQMKKKMADKLVDFLVGVDSALEGHPELRGKVLVTTFPNTDEFKPPAIMSLMYGQTTLSVNKDGTMNIAITVNPNHLLADVVSGPNLAKGQLNHYSVAVSGTSTGALMTGSHEGGHVLQPKERLAVLGLRLPIDDDTLLTQLSNYGPTMSDTFPGLLVSSSLGLDPSLSWLDAQIAWEAQQALLPAGYRVPFEKAVGDALIIHPFLNGNAALTFEQQQMARAVTFGDMALATQDVGFVTHPAGYAGPLIVMPSTDEARANPKKMKEAVVRTVLANYNLLTAGGRTPTAAEQKMLFDMLRQHIDIDRSISSLDDFGREYFGEVLGNQKFTEFLEQGQQMFWGNEAPFRGIAHPGMTDEYFSTLGELSLYAKTLPVEHQSEGQAFMSLLKIGGDSMRRDDPRIDEVRKIMSETLPQRPDGKPDAMRPAPEGAAEWLKKTQDMVAGSRMPSFKKDTIDQYPVDPSTQPGTSAALTMAARGTSGPITGRIVSSVLDRVLARSGADDDTKEKVKIGLGLATAFGSGGPAGAASYLAIEAARRGGRDVAEFTLQELVKRGKITPEQARLAMAGVDRIAPQGLPEGARRRLEVAFSETADFYDRVNTPENRQRFAEMTEDAIEGAIDRARDARDRAREVAQDTRERVQELGESAREMTQDVRERTRELGESARDRIQGIRGRIRGRRGSDAGSEASDTDGFVAQRSFDGNDPASPLPIREYQLYTPSEETDPTKQSIEMFQQSQELLNRRFPKESIIGDTSFVARPGKRGDEEIGIKTWDIAGEKVQFTNPGYETVNDSSVKQIERSVKGLTGLDPASPEGYEVAQKYSAALHASQRVNSHDSTYVDALLYAASRGDAAKQEEFEELARIGEQLIADQKKLKADTLMAFAAERQDVIDKDPTTSGLEFDGLHSFHETSYDLDIDENGNLRLWPAGQFHQETGDVRRSTIHTSINHTVEGVFGRPEAGVGARRVVIFKVADAVAANPDSLDNLYTVDTYYVPKPGEPLTIPAGQFRVVEYADEAGEITEESRKVALKKLRDEEAAKVREGSDGIRMFQGGTHYSTESQDALLARFAGERGVSSGLHANEHGFPSPLDSSYEDWETTDDGRMIKHYRQPPADLFNNLSRNARAQVVSHGDWSGHNSERYVGNDGPDSGF